MKKSLNSAKTNKSKSTKKTKKIADKNLEISGGIWSKKGTWSGGTMGGVGGGTGNI